MKVVALREFGQEPTVTEVEVPQPAAGEVRVRVHAASVNGFDLSVGKGMLQGAMEHRFPVVLGKDFAGTVDAVGEGVEGYAVGDRVFGVVTKEFLGDGSFGEYVTVPTAVGLAHLPDEIEFTQGAGLGLAGTAAVMAVDAADIREGATVLVVGATGGVGQHALQLAVRAGATVIATAHSAQEVQQVRDLGAAHTVDHTGDLVAQVAAIAPQGVDVVLHFAGAPDAVVGAVKPGGAFVSTMLRSPADVPAPQVRVESIYAHPAPETLERLARDHAARHTTVTVQRVYDLEQAPAAFADFAAGTLGKLVIRIA
jgi:NADPH2:quinone reductase